MRKFQYTSLDTVFSKFNRDLRGTDITEADLIEWSAEALGFMKVVEIQEEAVAFLEVRDYQAEVPIGFQTVLQIAKDNNWSEDKKEICPFDVLCSYQNIEEDSTAKKEVVNNGVIIDCKGRFIDDVELAYYRPYFDLKWEYQLWTSSPFYKSRFSPVRLANHTFFNSLVAKEVDMGNLYMNTMHEYTIVGDYPNTCLRFNFKTGFIALSYLRAVVDEETGYPVIPDDVLFITAITYYIKWKMAERLRWSGREGFNLEAQDAEAKWLKYVRQAINKAKMPQGIDQYQNLMEQSLYLIPRTRKYYGFFGNLGREEDRKFNNPDNRRRFYLRGYGR